MVLALLAALSLPLTGTYRLPPGTTEISSELKLPAGAHDLTIMGTDRTVLRAASNFHGRAILSCTGCRKIKFYNFAIDGNRGALAKAVPIAPPDQSFSSAFSDNGILIEETDGLEIDHVDFTNIASFAVLVNHSRDILLDHMHVENSGSLNAQHRNNTTGGILLEEGTSSFTVADSMFQNVRGNAVWTHSRYRSPRNQDGKIANNQFFDIGRDAIQIGHAINVDVNGNRGRRIGFPNDLVDAEGGGTPVAIDTAGNVENTTYGFNQFEEVNGKCIDLDGFHDGTIRANTCRNSGKPEEYPFGHFGIVFNNANPDMQSQNILVEENQLDGMKFGGIFLIGSGHRILHNRLLNINTAHCNENRAQFGCSALGEPEVLETGIYLGSHAERPAPARDNIVEGNTIRGWKMKTRCIQAAPGVKLSENTIKGNQCSDE
ncbi:MAG TPA: right-handed parallel beta-helix repeat-containing protein [Bryobacteraceae bacterium]|nr:right-handed parallel beta-helix repeat-containing protein [Bryobacteraceae bacterium]